MSDVTAYVERMLPTNVVFLVCNDPSVNHISVVRDSECLERGLPLADVLAEESDVALSVPSLVTIVPLHQIKSAVANGREAELAGRIVATASAVIEQSRFDQSADGCTFFALLHCYDTLIDLGFSRTHGINLARFMSGFVRAGRTTKGLGDRLDSLSKGRILPDAQSVQNGAVLKSLVFRAKKVPFDLLADISALPATFDLARPALGSVVKVDGV
ncbi:hypothetical protein [Roseivivax sp. CAU 1753]